MPQQFESDKGIMSQSSGVCFSPKRERALALGRVGQTKTTYGSDGKVTLFECTELLDRTCILAGKTADRPYPDCPIRIKAYEAREEPDAGILTIQTPGYDLTYDRNDVTVTRSDRPDNPIHLMPLEASILSYLMRHQGQRLNATQIMEGAHPEGFTYGSSVGITQTYISMLRAKIDQPGEPSLISTKRSFGYMIPKRKPLQSR